MTESDPLLSLVPKARRRWARTDPALAALAREHPPTRRAIEGGSPFRALVTSIAHQQVSIHAGRAVMGRLEAATAADGGVAPGAVLKLGADGLRAAGFSRPKIAYALDLAQKVEAGAVDFARIAASSDAEAIATLTEVKGIGVWTAKMFLLFHLHRPDVLPHEDLGVQIAAADLYDVPRARIAEKVKAMGPAWSPYASVAVLTLWDWRRKIMAGEAPAPAARKRAA